MVFARAILLLLGILGVLMLGAVPPTLAETAPPCHEMTAGDHDESSSSERPLKSMACCAACIAPAIVPPVRAPVVLTRQTPTAPARVLPVGRKTAPDTGPPKA